MKPSIIPIFIFSLPRSGSTLCQRVLAAHDEVATASESHILLPLFYTLKEKGVYSEYSHAYTVKGIRAFCQELPGGEADYHAEIREFVLHLYAKAAGEQARYFVDKAGAYHLIVEEIINHFPDARFIFLWRNPLAVIASLMTSWRDGKWNLYEHLIYLYDGLPKLVAACQRHADHVCMVRYEDLIIEPAGEWRRIFAYLDLQYESGFLDRFAQVHLRGDLGDQPGMRRYRKLNAEPLEKWKSTLSNPIRKAWCRRYLQFIGRERLAYMGYDLDALSAELRGLPPSLRYLPGDIWRIPYGAAFRFLERKMVKEKLRRWRAGERIYLHQ